MNLIANAIRAAKTGAKATSKGQPFYSAADKAALALSRPKGTGKEFMTELKKTKGVKPVEIQHRKLEQIEEMPKMTKEQFLAELEKRPPADVSENVLEPISDDLLDDIAEEMFPGNYGSTMYQDLRPHQQMQVDDAVKARSTSYDQYQIPRGENYREILLQLPSFTGEERLMYLDAKKRHGGLHPELAREYEQLKEEKASFDSQYLSRHWEGNPNVLAHMRVSDRMVESPPEMRYVAINKKSGFPSPDFATQEELDAYIKTLPENIQNSLVVKQAQIAKPPKKVLHVEEIQSDWHQEGRKKGYNPEDYIQQSNSLDKEFSDLGNRRAELLKQAEAMPTHGPEFTNLIDEANSITPKLVQLQEQRDNMRKVINYGVPDAPFKKNWHELAMKRLINYAAENGYDSVAITPGAEQAKRYDLSKHINEISYSANPDGTYSLTAIDKNGRPAINKPSISESELEDTVGKEMAKKIVEGQGKEFPAGSVSEGKKSLTGLDLQVGGEGMTGFYDKILPDYLNQFGKPYGAQVELGGFKIKGDPSMRGEASERLGLAGQRFDEMTPEEIEAFNAKLDEANTTSLHNFPITPQMREEVTQKGLPMYQQIGLPIGAGSAGTQIEVPQKQETEELEYAMGGAVGNTTPDMSDGGQIIQGNTFKHGGKVHFTDNLDTMFMELQDKMFKRK